MSDCSLAEAVDSGLHGHSSAAPSLTLPLGLHLYGDRDSGLTKSFPGQGGCTGQSTVHMCTEAPRGARGHRPGVSAFFLVPKGDLSLMSRDSCSVQNGDCSCLPVP